jgi:hypothetical protein
VILFKYKMLRDVKICYFRGSPTFKKGYSSSITAWFWRWYFHIYNTAQQQIYTVSKVALAPNIQLIKSSANQIRRGKSKNNISIQPIRRGARLSDSFLMISVFNQPEEAPITCFYQISRGKSQSN